MPMDPLSGCLVLIGAVIIATRGPLIFAPTATLRVFQSLLSTNARIRGIAVVLAPLGVALLALPLGEGDEARALRAFGWLWTAAIFWLLAAPGSYRVVAGGVVAYLESSVPEAAIRTIGVVAVAIGIALIYFGVSMQPGGRAA